MSSFKKMMKTWNFLFENKTPKANSLFLAHEYMNCSESGAHVELFFLVAAEGFHLLEYDKLIILL